MSDIANIKIDVDVRLLNEGIIRRIPKFYNLVTYVIRPNFLRVNILSWE
jgi:hypothetical protein